MSKPTVICMLSWNIWRGGFDRYNSAQVKPEREKAIKNFIEGQHTANGLNTVFLSDAYRWGELYGDDKGIAQHLGYRNAIFMPLNDTRIEALIGSGAGNVFATDLTIEHLRILDLGTRQGLAVILRGSAHSLQIAAIHLDDLSEETRIKQARALLASLEKDIPTVIIGDFNTLRPSMRGAGFDIQAKDAAVRLLTHLAPKKYAEFNKRQLIPLIESSGFIDADRCHKNPQLPLSFRS